MLMLVDMLQENQPAKRAGGLEVAHMAKTKLASSALKAMGSRSGDDCRFRSVQLVCVPATVALAAFLMLWLGPGIFPLVVGLYLFVLIYLGVRDVKELVTEVDERRRREALV